MTALTIRSVWLPGEVASELDATMCKLTILIGRRNITEYTAARARGGSSLDIPAYFLAEWMAENWWALLHEPKKDEEKDDPEYRERHSLLAAHHGFAVPNLSIMPVGRAIHVFATRHYAHLAEVTFERSAAADASRLEIEGVLKNFISGCIDVLVRHGFKDTPLQEAWRLVEATADDQREFCELAGALGLSPYNADDDIANSFDLLVDVLGTRATRDLCLASTPSVLLRTTDAAQEIASKIDAAPDADIAALSQMSLPDDNFHAPGWRRGLEAARKLAREFRLDNGKANAADVVFERLSIDPSKRADALSLGSNGRGWLPFNCAIRRNDTTARVAIVPEDETQRRFAAARAVYFAWISKPQEQRLATAAVTRDQQASRQFGAEILVPRAYLEAQAVRGVLSYGQAHDIAEKRRASPWVVYYQANNSGIRVGSI
jgi:hypothetical protein